MTSPPDQSTLRMSYSRFLLVARIFYVPALVLIGLAGLTVFAAVLAGARHASEGAINQALGTMALFAVSAAVLPLLVFIPDRGPGHFVRRLHALGALCLAIGLGLAGSILWRAVGAEVLKRWQVERGLANLSLTQASAEPIQAGETLIGVRLNVEFALANDVVMYQVGVPVSRAMSSLKIQATDPTRHNFPFPDYPGRVTVTYNGQPLRGEKFFAGRYQVTQVVWFAGLSMLDGDETPCKGASEFGRADRRDAFIAAGKTQWIVTATQKQADLWGSMVYRSNSVVWQARSAPLDLDINSSTWLAELDALPLPDCAARQAELEAARKRERIEAFYENRLSPDNANQVLHSILCADDIGPLRKLVTRGIPLRPIYREAMRCAQDKRRPEILEILGPRLVVYPDDIAEHCSSLTAIHSALDVQRLLAFVRAGLPINCETKNGDAWRSGLKTRTRWYTSPEEIAREVEWIRLLVEQKVPVCVRAPNDDLTVLQSAAWKGSVESLAAWLEAGCNPAERADPVTSNEPGLRNYSARLLWFLRRHQVPNSSVYQWSQLSADEALNTRVTRRMGPPDANELNTPFAKRGGVVPLHDFVTHALKSPRMLRELVDLGARLDAASDSKAKIAGINGPYYIEPMSWFMPGYDRDKIGVGFVAALDILTRQELRTLITPVNLTTGKPAAAMPQASNFDDAPYGLAYYLCKRKIQACPNPVQ